jgi:hypothetical protein
MNRQRNRRLLASVHRARRIRPMPAASQRSPIDHLPPANRVAEETALAFLSDVLAGDRAWTAAEVRRLVAMREAAELGHWRDTGLDDEATIRG